MRPREHPGGLVLIEELQPHEQAEDGAAKGLGHPCRVVDRPRHERPVGPEPAVGDEETEVRMPVGAYGETCAEPNDLPHAARRASRMRGSVDSYAHGSIAVLINWRGKTAG